MNRMEVASGVDGVLPVHGLCKTGQGGATQQAASSEPHLDHRLDTCRAARRDYAIHEWTRMLLKPPGNFCNGRLRGGGCEGGQWELIALRLLEIQHCGVKLLLRRPKTARCARDCRRLYAADEMLEVMGKVLSGKLCMLRECAECPAQAIQQL